MKKIYTQLIEIDRNKKKKAIFNLNQLDRIRIVTKLNPQGLPTHIY